MELCPVLPAAASSYASLCCCLQDGCYRFPLFFGSHGNVSPAEHLRQPLPACSPAAFLTPLSPARGSASLCRSFLFTSNPGDAGAVTCCPGYICTRYLFSHVNIHQAIPNLVEAADKSPLASLRELNMWCSPCSSSAMHLKANPSPRGHQHKATPTAKQEYSIRSAALGVIGMDG